jgi:ABC-type transport system substrate-binding protein
MRLCHVVWGVLGAVVALGGLAAAGAPTPSGRVAMAWHVTIAPSWFDPSTAPPQITPFGMLYAIHDALVRPYPGHKMGPSLAESWEESEDGLVYEFKLRPGLRFHNGDSLTTEDVKFSFERYKGAAAKTLHDRVAEVEIVDPRVVRFHLKAPWPDFMTFYGTTASAAGLVVPKNYLAQVGDDGFKKHPVGAGPYKFVSQTPGIEVELEANADYWRRVPNVKTLVMKSVPEATTRAVMLKTGETDISIVLDGPDAEAIQHTPGMQVVASPAPSGELRARSPAHQRGGVPRLLPARGRDRAARYGFRLAGRSAALRSRQGQTAARRGRLPEWHRCRRLYGDPRISHGGRGGRERPQRRRHPRAAAPDGARRVLRRLAGEEAARAVHDRRGQFGQRR